MTVASLFQELTGRHKGPFLCLWALIGFSLAVPKFSLGVFLWHLTHVWSVQVPIQAVRLWKRNSLNSLGVPCVCWCLGCRRGSASHAPPALPLTTAETLRVVQAGRGRKNSVDGGQNRFVLPGSYGQLTDLLCTRTFPHPPLSPAWALPAPGQRGEVVPRGLPAVARSTAVPVQHLCLLRTRSESSRGQVSQLLCKTQSMTHTRPL